MTTINTNFKADITDLTTDTSSDASADIKVRLEDALRDLEQFRTENAAFLSEESLIEMERLESTMKAEMAAIEAYGVGGAAGTAGTSVSSWDKPTDLEAGWNVPTGGTIDIQTVASDAELCDGEYQGTVRFEGPQIAFSLQDDGIEKLDVKSAGKDLVFTVTYSDGTKKSWVLVDGSVRPELVEIDATLMNREVTIDASQAVRISDGKHGVPYGQPISGLQIWGSSYDDTIYGSQGYDGIVGLAGNDTIDGMAGNDKIFGDDFYNAPGGYAASVDGSAPGNDDLRGGAGTDTIMGGAGIDISYTSDGLPEVVADMGEVVDDTTSAPDPDEYGWLALDGWSWEEDDDGSILLSKNGTSGGSIDVDMDSLDGYNMAFASKAEDGSMVITFVGHDEDGNPQSFNMKIEDFYADTTNMDPADAIVTLNVTGSEGDDIIDFSQIRDLTNQNVNIYGGGGNDVILGVEAKMVKDGIDFENWDTSTARGDATRAAGDMFAYDDVESDTWEGWKARFDETTGQIVIENDTEHPYAGSADTRTCTIVAPEGYDHGYVTKQGDITYVILVNDEGKTVVVQFNDPSLDINNINVWDRRPESPSSDDDSHTAASPVQLIPVSFNDEMYVIDGGEDADMIFGIKGSNFVTDDSDYVVKSEPHKDATIVSESEPEVEEEEEVEDEHEVDEGDESEDEDE